jgi:hypothetical protein
MILLTTVKFLFLPELLAKKVRLACPERDKALSVKLILTRNAAHGPSHSLRDGGLLNYPQVHVVFETRQSCDGYDFVVVSMVEQVANEDAQKQADRDGSRQG